MILYDYFRSSAAYRVRIALNLKGLAAERRFVHLRKGEIRVMDQLRSERTPHRMQKPGSHDPAGDRRDDRRNNQQLQQKADWASHLITKYAK